MAGNYYPVNAAAYLAGEDAQFSVLVDRSQVGRLRFQLFEGYIIPVVYMYLPHLPTYLPTYRLTGCSQFERWTT